MGDIFISRRIFSEIIQDLRAKGHQVEVNDSSKILSQEELINKTRGKDGLICLLNDNIDEGFLEELSDLKIVSNVAVGYDNINVEVATKNNIMVSNTPGVLTETTADLTFSLLLSAARRIPEADKYSREGKYDGWELMQPHMGVDVYGKTLGIVGMGRIGKAVAKRAHKGFDMDIVYYSRSRKLEVEDSLGADYVSFDELLRGSDFISIHTPLTPKTRGMFGEEEFGKMKDESILVNASRGPVVDEDKLANAIVNGDVRGAAIDTFEDEPNVNEKLAELKEFLVLTPHIGSASEETRLKMAKMAIDNVNKALKGEKPPNIINPEVL